MPVFTGHFEVHFGSGLSETPRVFNNLLPKFPIISDNLYLISALIGNVICSTVPLAEQLTYEINTTWSCSVARGYQYILYETVNKKSFIIVKSVYCIIDMTSLITFARK